MRKRMIIFEEPKEPNDIVKSICIGIFMAITMTPVIFLFYAFLKAAWSFGEFLGGLVF